MEPLRPVSIHSVGSLPRMRLLNTLSDLVDLSSEDSVSHNLGPKYRSECLPYVTELYLGPRSGEIRLLQTIPRAMFFKNVASITLA